MQFKKFLIGATATRKLTPRFKGPEQVSGGDHLHNPHKTPGGFFFQLCQIVDEWIEICAKDGRPFPPPTADKTYSGKFQLRLGSELHQALAIRALQTGDSLNNFCIKSLKKSLSKSDNVP